MYEAIFTTLIVGMAIDYSVHLAHFYNESFGTRYQKAQAVRATRLEPELSSLKRRG